MDDPNIENGYHHIVNLLERPKVFTRCWKLYDPKSMCDGVEKLCSEAYLMFPCVDIDGLVFGCFEFS